VKGGTSTLGLPLDSAMLVGATAIAVTVGAWMYPKVVMEGDRERAGRLLNGNDRALTRQLQ